MKQIALSMKQMDHLKELGVDTSDASLCWVVDAFGNYKLEVYDKLSPEIHHLHPIPAYTLQDIIDKLPRCIGTGFDFYKICIEPSGGYWTTYYYRADATELISVDDENLINSAYEMLCWVLKECPQALKGGKE